MSTAVAPHVIMVSAICGYIAMWATRQSPYHAPNELTEVLQRFQTRIEREGVCETLLGCLWIRLDTQSPAVHLRKILTEYLLSDPSVQKWNERKNGNKSPFGFVSRYDRPNPDDDFIDLDALVGNIARSVMEEYRADVRSGFIQRTWRQRIIAFVRNTFAREELPKEPTSCPPL